MARRVTGEQDERSADAGGGEALRLWEADKANASAVVEPSRWRPRHLLEAEIAGKGARAVTVSAAAYNSAVTEPPELVIVTVYCAPVSEKAVAGVV